MKVYFHLENSADVLDSKDIIKYLKQASVELINTSQDGQVLDKVDALIVQAKQLDAQSGYMVAMALTQNKQVLCLLPENTRLDNSMDKLKKDSKLLHIKFYNSHNLQQHIFDFIKLFDDANFSNAVNIKYTLRLSHRIATYLNWKAEQTGVKKADWLREQVSDIMEKDQEYKEYLKNKFSNHEKG